MSLRRTKVFYIKKPAMRVFRSSQSIQRGHGIGGLFRGLLRVAKPFMKKTLLSAGEKALNMGANALHDIRENNSTAKQAMLNQLCAQKPINRRANKRKASSVNKKLKRKVAKKVNLEAVTIPTLQ